MRNLIFVAMTYIVIVPAHAEQQCRGFDPNLGMMMTYDCSAFPIQFHPRQLDPNECQGQTVYRYDDTIQAYRISCEPLKPSRHRR